MYQSMMENIVSGAPWLLFGEYELPMEIQRAASELVERLESQLRGVPYGQLVDQILRGEGIDNHPFGDGEFHNVIPGEHKLACTRVTLALSTVSHRGNSLSFPVVMRSVREYLIDCERMARAVVLLTDTWNPRHIQEHIRDVHAHARQGRFVIPHLVTGNQIVRVEWPTA